MHTSTCICEHSGYSDFMFSRHDSGSSLVHGPYSKDFCQEPPIFSEDAFQSAKGGQRRKEENVKESAFFFFINQPFRKVRNNKWSLVKRYLLSIFQTCTEKNKIFGGKKIFYLFHSRQLFSIKIWLSLNHCFFRNETTFTNTASFKSTRCRTPHGGSIKNDTAEQRYKLQIKTIS